MKEGISCEIIGYTNLIVKKTEDKMKNTVEIKVEQLAELNRLAREYWVAEENEGCFASHAIAKNICMIIEELNEVI